MKVPFLVVYLGLALGCGASLAWAGSSFVGTLELVEQYAPGLSGSASALCLVRVPAQAVQNKPACATGGTSTRYYYAWECDEPRRKNFLGLALAAYLGSRQVQLVGSGTCTPTGVYENLNYFVLTEQP